MRIIGDSAVQNQEYAGSPPITRGAQATLPPSADATLPSSGLGWVRSDRALFFFIASKQRQRIAILAPQNIAQSAKRKTPIPPGPFATDIDDNTPWRFSPCNGPSTLDFSAFPPPAFFLVVHLCCPPDDDNVPPFGLPSFTLCPGETLSCAPPHFEVTDHTTNLNPPEQQRPFRS
ncbi:uncharacterized protein CLUP02_00364 [Colletotrichum lupini]|uniref:Uncharacterized protein n=1 Tax=Colletotrichum lupini TaxID=145971 RepID=A0A9Q8W6Y6_9PEZI|nr:uncharacterized protein CLUP02_00364 [Colletotrichum lupini]UQC73718.1 hypothetical protein CLUP02_00364 [Colletotrichum lupini]